MQTMVRNQPKQLGKNAHGQIVLDVLRVPQDGSGEVTLRLCDGAMHMKISSQLVMFEFRVLCQFFRNCQTLAA